VNQPLAYVHSDSKLDDTVVVEPFVTIHKDVEIGKGSWIGSNVTIFPGTRIGDNCKVYPGAVIGATPQDLKYKGEQTLTIIGNNTIVRECVTVHKGTEYANKTQVGENCMLMAYSHVAHDCILGNNVIIANNVQLAGHINIGDFAILEGMAAVQQFVKIGEHSFISGGSLVRKDVPPFVKAAREPLSYVGVNSIGMRRRGFTQKQIHHIQDVYRIIFVRGYPVNKALNLVEAEIRASDERDKILDFIRKSVRGVMKGFQHRTKSNGNSAH